MEQKKPLVDKYDESKWRVRLTSDRKKVVFTDRSVGLADSVPSAHCYDPSEVVANAFCYKLPWAYERICAVYQVDEREFIIMSRPDEDCTTPIHVIGIRLSLDGKDKTLFSAQADECWWVSEGRLLYIKGRNFGDDYYYSVHLRHEISHFFFQETGECLNYEIISSSGPDGLGGLRVRTTEKVLAEFDVDIMEPLSECAYSTLRKRSIPIANFHDFVSILKEDEDDVKKAEEFYTYDRFCGPEGEFCRDRSIKIVEALKPEFLKRHSDKTIGALTDQVPESSETKYVEAEYRFKPWPIAQGKFAYDEEKYFISRANDDLIIERLCDGAIVVIEGGFCAGLLQLKDEYNFLAVFKEGRDDTLWLERFELRYDVEDNTMRHEPSFSGIRYLLENADCQYTEDLICTANGIYSISKDAFITDWTGTRCSEHLAIDTCPIGSTTTHRFPAFFIGYGYGENSVFAIFDPIYNGIIGGVAYNRLAQSFVKATSLEDCKRIADENKRLSEWAKAAISAISP